MSKIVFFLFVVVIYITIISGVLGNPKTNSIQDSELLETLSRNKRQVQILKDVGKKVGDAFTKCSEKAGCHKGNCWAYCGLNLAGGDWCYTTKAHSQSYQYVSCTDNSECDPCWKCAGSCTL